MYNHYRKKYMKHSILNLSFLLCAFLFMVGCEETAVPEDVARQLTVEQAKVEPGFTWLEPTMATYTPDAAAVNSIKTAYNADPNRSVIVYVNPSCTCDGSRVLVPHALRSLLEAGIPENKISIYVMRTSKAKHPNTDKYVLRGLPNIYLLKGDKTVFYIESENEVAARRTASESPKPIGVQDKIEAILAEGFAL